MPTDKDGKTLQVGDSVIVPPPNATDSYVYDGWAGTILNFKDNDELAAVEDNQGDVYDIECNRLELYLRKRA